MENVRLGIIIGTDVAIATFPRSLSLVVLNINVDREGSFQCRLVAKEK